MKRIAILQLKMASIAILSAVFLVFVALSLLARTKPELVISMITRMAPSPTPSPLQIKGIAVIGDSQSDEYRADDNRGENYPSTTLSWVELLQQYRKLNFGKWDTYDEPRRIGFTYNFARTGATTRSMIVSGQHTGVAEAVKKGEVNLVIIYIGANDFAPFITEDGYEALYNETITSAQITHKINILVADIKTAIETIQQAGDARILLVKIPDWGNHLGVQVAFPDPQRRFLIADVIDSANIELEKLAEEKHLLTADPNAFYDTLSENQQNGRITIGKIAAMS